MKIMLDNPNVEQAEFFGLLRRERVAKVVGGRFLVGPVVGKNCTPNFIPLSASSSGQCPISACQKSSARGGSDILAIGSAELGPSPLCDAAGAKASLLDVPGADRFPAIIDDGVEGNRVGIEWTVL